MSRKSSSTEATPIALEHRLAIGVGQREVSRHYSSTSLRYPSTSRRRVHLRRVGRGGCGRASPRRRGPRSPSPARRRPARSRRRPRPRAARRRRTRPSRTRPRRTSRPSRSCAPTCGRLVVDELAEGVLRVPGDAEHGLVALHPRPVVLGVVAEIVRIGLGCGQLRSPCGRGVSSRRARGARLPRTSIVSSVPGAASAAGTYAIPMPRSRLGECVPRGDLAALGDRHPRARDRLLLHDERDELPLGPASLIARSRSTPVKSLSSAQTQPSPAEIASVSGEMSLPCSG